MRIVVFSDLYPPLFMGGYEIGAAAVVGELRRRGHEVLLVSARDCFLQRGHCFRQMRHCSQHGPGLVDTGLCVFGSLPRLFRTNPIRFVGRAAAMVLARRRYRRAVAAFRPERVLLFNPLGVVAPLVHDLAELAHKAGAEVHAYVSDDWLAEWPAANPLRRALSRLCHAGHPALRLAGLVLTTAAQSAGWAPPGLPRIDRVFYCSDFIRRLSLPRAWRAAGHEVVPWGLADTEKLPAPAPGHFHGDAPLTLLFAGQIHERKGLDVLLRAVAGCRAAHHLVVLGEDTTSHAQACRRLTAELGLMPRVHFLGKRSHADALALLGRLGHVLVVPSVWDEPLSIALLEGMALGLPVVAAATGGTPEAVRDGDTGFLFGRGRTDELIAIIDRLEIDRELCGRVGARARRSLRQHYTIERMVDRLLGEDSVLAAPRQAA
jgi:glycosyltransferase involved in cell wall biosynthesis